MLLLLNYQIYLNYFRREGGSVRGLSGTCTHYGAPLVKGVLGSNKIICPFHGACFNATTGSVHCSTLPFTTPQYTAVHCSTLQYTTVPYTPLHHYATTLHFTKLQYNALLYVFIYYFPKNYRIIILIIFIFNIWSMILLLCYMPHIMDDERWKNSFYIVMNI